MSDIPPPATPPPSPPAVPPPGAQPAQPARDNVTLFGVIGIIAAFICCPPLGILFGYLSMQEARKLGKDQVIGKVAFWAGIIMTALAVLGTILSICLGGFGMWSSNDWNY
jgi:hypothetical protein